MMDVAFGMEYLHGRNIVHFDLKSDNLLVNLRDSHRPICKVSDSMQFYSVPFGVMYTGDMLTGFHSYLSPHDI